ncbi:Bestrophin [Oesophagostomum dentatum]|uniref:Bestrophin homolog n=1 Tax=Oesophagostomum dentatum TaxID=61180 RepID=A0A0B1SY05_OESDE|nr:Bestrophin [Oesophagostomum dentatum]
MPSLIQKILHAQKTAPFSFKATSLSRWEQFNWISWPDKMMMMVSACLPGKENLTIRQAIARWSSLQAAIAWSGISVRTLKRFPTERHMVEAKLMTEEEYDMFVSLEAPHGKWFVPIMWIVNLLKKQYALKKIDSIQMDMLLRQVYSWRDGFAMLFVYDWVKIPLVYTQVVAIATYGYFFICLIGRQPKLDQKSMETVSGIKFLGRGIEELFLQRSIKISIFLRSEMISMHIHRLRFAKNTAQFKSL